METRLESFCALFQLELSHSEGTFDTSQLRNGRVFKGILSSLTVVGPDLMFASPKRNKINLKNESHMRRRIAAKSK